MRYSTSFSGQFKLSKPLTAPQLNYLRAFADIRHVARNRSKASELLDMTRLGAGLPIGDRAEFYVGPDTSTITDHNSPPDGVPSMYCQWIPTEDGDGLKWDGEEKFYNYREWLQFYIDNFFARWGIQISGRVRFQGEETTDGGFLYIDADGNVAQKTFEDVDLEDGPDGEDGPWAPGYEERSNTGKETLESVKAELDTLRNEFEDYKNEVDRKIESAIDEAVGRAVYRVGNRLARND